MGGPQAGERALTLLGRAEHADIDARGAQVWGGVHFGHGHESDPRILELGRDRIPENLSNRLVDAPHPGRRHRPATITVPHNRYSSRPIGSRSFPNVTQAEQVALKRAAIRAAAVDEADQAVDSVRDATVADQRAEQNRPLP